MNISIKDTASYIALITGISLTIAGLWDYPNNNIIMPGIILTITSTTAILFNNLKDYKSTQMPKKDNTAKKNTTKKFESLIPNCSLAPETRKEEYQPSTPATNHTTAGQLQDK